MFDALGNTDITDKHVDWLKIADAILSFTAVLFTVMFIGFAVLA